MNFTKLNELPEKKIVVNEEINSEFISEEMFIKPIDYYYSNSISRASKTMSECRQINQKIKKTG